MFQCKTANITMEFALRTATRGIGAHLSLPGLCLPIIVSMLKGVLLVRLTSPLRRCMVAHPNHAGFFPRVKELVAEFAAACQDWPHHQGRGFRSSTSTPFQLHDPLRMALLSRH